MLWVLIRSTSVRQWGASNEYPQYMFLERNKKNIMWIPPLICSYGSAESQADRELQWCKFPEDQLFLNIYMFSDVSLNEALHSDVFYFWMKNNIRCSHQGRHKVEIKNIACEHQSIVFFVYWSYNDVASILLWGSVQVSPDCFKSDFKQTLTPGVIKNISC